MEAKDIIILKYSPGFKFTITFPSLCKSTVLPRLSARALIWEPLRSLIHSRFQCHHATLWGGGGGGGWGTTLKTAL